MFWKKTGLVSIILAALAIVGYAQTQKPRSTNLQGGASGYLGVGLWAVQDLTPDNMKSLGLKDRAGVLVTSVNEGQPGAKAGIHQYDVILEFDGQKIDSSEQLLNSIVGKAPGTKVNLTISRNGTKLTFAPILGTRPSDLPVMRGMAEPGARPADIAQLMAAAVGALPAPQVGFQGLDLEAQLAEFFGVREGVLVTQVYEKTPAERAGLKAGDVVVKVNNMPVANSREISGIVRQAGKKPISFTVVRNKREVTLNLELASNRSDQSDRGDIN